jgi:hypothetical protein
MLSIKWLLKMFGISIDVTSLYVVIKVFTERNSNFNREVGRALMEWE